MAVKDNNTQTPHLELRAAFEEVLQHYQPSEHARGIINDAQFVVLTGPSGAGRNTLIRELAKTDRYHFVVSTTTRPKRVNNGVYEQDGREYWFRTEQEVLDDLRAGEFLEAEIVHGQQVSGISIAELERASLERRIAITDVDIEGITNVMQAKPDAIPILVFPPSFEAWRQRLNGRGEMDIEQLKRRLVTAARIYELPEKDEQYRIVINDTIEHATHQIRAITEEGAFDPIPRDEARAIARQLREDTLRRLAEL